MTIQYPIRNRWTCEVQFTAEIDCADDAPDSTKCRLAVLWAVENRADLSEADLSEADLSEADLSGTNLSEAYLREAYLRGTNLSEAYLREAYLRGADLREAYLRRANLRRANLHVAGLRGAYLYGANLSEADLSEADLSGTNLSEAYLRGTNLSEADLSEADLSGTNLSEAYLRGADLREATFHETIWRAGVTINRAPVFIGGLRWGVWLLDKHMQIGCECHSLAEWAAFDDRRIAVMAGRDALTFWRTHKDWLLAAAKADGRGVEPAKAEGEARP